MDKSITESSSSDFYGFWKGYVDTMFTYVEKTVPQYHQSITNLYNEYIESWKNFSCSAIDIQKGFAGKLGFATSLPDVAQKMGNDIIQESKSVVDVQNKVLITSIDSAKQSLHTINVNSNEFATINKKIFEDCSSLIQARA